MAEAATGSVLYKKVLLKILQNSQAKRGSGTCVFLWILQNF